MFVVVAVAYIAAVVELFVDVPVIQAPFHRRTPKPGLIKFFRILETYHIGALGS
jgi:hypothetical protein